MHLPFKLVHNPIIRLILYFRLRFETKPLVLVHYNVLIIILETANPIGIDRNLTFVMVIIVLW